MIAVSAIYVCDDKCCPNNNKTVVLDGLFHLASVLQQRRSHWINTTGPATGDDLEKGKSPGRFDPSYIKSEQTVQ